jgi:hypothetical protein
MNTHLIFATSEDDARALMEELELEFDETVWVLNAQLLSGSGDYSQHTVHYTDTFRQMPAFVEAVSIYGDGPLGSDVM